MRAGSAELAAELAPLVDGAEVRRAFGQSTVHVPADRWRAAAAATAATGCALFDWLGAEDAGRPGDAGRAVAVTLHVVDPVRRLGVLLRTELTTGTVLPSVAGVWAGAAWHEREAAEMFGLDLDGHPGPARLLLDAGFTAHPLRKDFVLAARVARPWPGRLEPGESGSAEPGARRRRATAPGVPEGWLR